MWAWKKGNAGERLRRCEGGYTAGKDTIRAASA
jgi:hypothetical protein